MPPAIILPAILSNKLFSFRSLFLRTGTNFTPSIRIYLSVNHLFITVKWHLSSVLALRHVRLCNPMDCSTPGFPLHHQLPKLIQTHVHWVRDAHPNISYSALPFSSCPQSFPASGSFKMNQFFTSGGQSIGGSDSASVFPMNIQDWFPLGWTGWISLQSKGLSRIFSNITVQKNQFFGSQLSFQFNSHIHTWLLEKP